VKDSPPLCRRLLDRNGGIGLTIQKETNTEDINKEISLLMASIKNLLGRIEKIFTKEIVDPKKFLINLRNREKYLNWIIKQNKIQFQGRIEHIYKRDIIYCNLGHNIGSEQNSKRPVVILQNDKGNSSSFTTIVAPISTHNNCVTTKVGDNYTIEFTNDEGQRVSKKLDYYEIPVELEPNYKTEITGYINLAQIRTIDKKRLDNTFVAKITHENFSLIKQAFNRLL